MASTSQRSNRSRFQPQSRTNRVVQLRGSDHIYHVDHLLALVVGAGLGEQGGDGADVLSALPVGGVSHCGDDVRVGLRGSAQHVDGVAGAILDPAGSSDRDLYSAPLVPGIPHNARPRLLPDRKSRPAQRAGMSALVERGSGAG